MDRRLNFSLAAEQGHASAQYILGSRYYEGKGVTKDYKEAIKWYTLAAEKGISSAQGNVGAMHYKGQGVSQDIQLAIKWYTLAAKQGSASAQYVLGSLNHNGQGVSQDYGKAMKWFKLAADQGNASAQENLGLIYHLGLGVTKDYMQAVKWYTLAAEQGKKSAKNRLSDLQYEVTNLIEEEEQTSELALQCAADELTRQVKVETAKAVADQLGMWTTDVTATKWEYRGVSLLDNEKGVGFDCEMLLQLSIKSDDGNNNIKGKVTYQYYTSLNYYYWDYTNVLEKTYQWQYDRNFKKAKAEIEREMEQTEQKYREKLGLNN